METVTQNFENNQENISLRNQEDLNNLMLKLREQEKKITCFCGGKFIASLNLINSHLNSKKHLYYLENDIIKVPEFKKQKELLFEPHFHEFETYFLVTYQLKCKKTKTSKFEFSEKNKDKKKILALKYFEHIKFNTEVLNKSIQNKNELLQINRKL